MCFPLLVQTNLLRKIQPLDELWLDDKQGFLRHKQEDHLFFFLYYICCSHQFAVL